MDASYGIERELEVSPNARNGSSLPYDYSHRVLTSMLQSDVSDEKTKEHVQGSYLGSSVEFFGNECVWLPVWYCIAIIP